MRYSLRNEDYSVKKSHAVVLIHGNACPHRAQLIQTCWKMFVKNSSNTLHTHQIQLQATIISLQLKKEKWGGQCFQTWEELILTVTNISPGYKLKLKSIHYVYFFDFRIRLIKKYTTWKSRIRGGTIHWSAILVMETTTWRPKS